MDYTSRLRNIISYAGQANGLYLIRATVEDGRVLHDKIIHK